LLARASGDVVEVPVEGVVPLLMMELGDVPTAEHVLCAGDRLLLYTDGITERECPDGTMFEESRLTSTMAKAAGLRPAEMLESLVTALDAFGAGCEPRDDQTLLLIAMS
jgi:sigma-B regulation protein RsbU (phosphoserine phosphatase)